jgi:hypothetical protein
MDRPKPRLGRTLNGMRWWVLVVGVLLVAVGGVWIFQGIGVLKGSFMTGQAFWGWAGGVCVLLGLPILTRGLRRARR